MLECERPSERATIIEKLNLIETLTKIIIGQILKCVKIILNILVNVFRPKGLNFTSVKDPRYSLAFAIIAGGAASSTALTFPIHTCRVQRGTMTRTLPTRAQSFESSISAVQ